MSDEKKLLSPEEADKLLASADGNAALLYLHILRGGSAAPAAAARELRRSEADMLLALRTLRQLGLLRPAQEPLRDETLPQLTTRDLKEVASKDPDFQSVVAEAEKALGRVFSDNDLRILFGIYNHMGLPADVILVLINHCIEEYQERSGPGRMPTMRYVEKEGWHWTGQEILNLDAAEAHLRMHRQRRAAADQAKEALQIRGRALTVSERAYLDSWLEMGFGPEAIAIAYDRMMLRTGKMTWKYMDSIMKSWNEKDLHTPEEIEAGDPAQRARSRAGVPAASNSQKVKQMQGMYDRMKKPDGGKGD